MLDKLIHPDRRIWTPSRARHPRQSPTIRPRPSTRNMADGQIFLAGDGTKSMNAAGNPLMDIPTQNCAICCCSPQFFSVTISGVTTATCPIPNSQNGSLPVGVCSYVNKVNGFVGSGDNFCQVLLTGNINATYRLPRTSLVSGCIYSDTFASPITATWYQAPTGGPASCGATPTPWAVASFTVTLDFGVGGGIAVNSVTLSVELRLVPIPFTGGPATATGSAFNFFNSLTPPVPGPGTTQSVCDTLCPLTTTTNLNAQYNWLFLPTSYELIATAGIGGSATFIPTS